MNKHVRQQRGYTLAEVLVALAIFAIIFLAALTAYDRSNRVFKTGVESSNMQQNTRVAFDKLVGDLRMAGYDFDRDGIPTGSVGGVNQYQQPDEQFEYIGPSAITIRGNFDYETENQPCSATVTDNCDNGREKTYEPPQSQFPVVTTGNDEIVTYALVHGDSIASPPPACDPSTNCIQFYADTHIPRRSYADVPNGGLDENVVEIQGVDLCNGGCNNPPYTLYRFTLDRGQQVFTGNNNANIIATPLASNIRSMTYKYYQDAQGTDPLKDLANTTDVSTGASIKGIGQYQVANPLALVPERDIRGKINSVRITLIGMNESRDAAFTDTAETVIGSPGYFEQYRKYRLETLVSPRNIQKRGMREQDTFPPGTPTGLQICTGACVGVWASWNAPVVNNIQGAPDQYKIIYDKDSSPGFLCEMSTFTNTFGPVFYQPGMSASCKFDPTVTYKFSVIALNSYGSSPPATAVTGVWVLNATQPDKPILTNATTTLNGKVTLTWKRPTSNFTGVYSCPTAPTVPDPAELLGYVVERETPAGSSNWAPILPTPTSQVTTSSPYDTVTWTDTTAANCVPYNYRVKAVESCAFNAAWNVGNNAGLGTSPYSVVLPGSATTTLAPQAPSNLTVDNGPPTNCYPVTPPLPALPTTLCDVHMFWPPVTLDTAAPTPNPVTITTYKIIATPFAAGAPISQNVLNATVNPSGNVEGTFTGLDIGSGQLYNFTVVAHSNCPVATGGTDSAPSPARPYPCPFPVGVVGSPLITSSAFDGDGSPANPFKIASGTSADATINILSPAGISAVIGRDYTGTTLKWGPAQCPMAPCSPVNPPYTFTWPLTANTTERFDVTVRENGGCVMQVSAYYEDEPQNCCLWPASQPVPQGSGLVDPISFSAGTPYVDFILENICGQPLTITGLDYTWSNASTSGGTKVDSIFFTTTSGGCSQVGFAANCAAFNYGGGGSSALSDSLGPAQIPAGTATIPAGSTTTKVRIHFTKTLTTSQPVTAFTLHYTDASHPGGVSCTVK